MYAQPQSGYAYAYGRDGLHRGMSRDTERVLKEVEWQGHNEARQGIYVYQ